MATKDTSAAWQLDELGLFPFWREGSAEFREEFLKVVRRAILPTGDRSLQQGQACHDVRLILDGSLRVVKCGDDGQEITLYRVGRGEACPSNILCAVTGRSFPAVAVAETDVRAALVPAADFRRWAHDHRPVCEFVLAMTAGRLFDLMDLVGDVAFQRMDSRLAEFLLDRFHCLPRQSDSLEIRHEDIASELGSAREVVSRVLKEFEKAGAVRLARGRITLGDEALLKRFGQRRSRAMALNG